MRESVGVALSGMQHCAGPLHQQSPQVGVSALGNVPKARPTAGGMLAWSQAEPGGELPAAHEVAGVSYGSHNRQCRERPEATNLHQPTRGLALPGAGLELSVVSTDALIEQRQV